MRAALLLLLLGAAAWPQDPPPPKPFPAAREEYEAAAEGEDAARLAKALGELARSGLLSDDKADRRFARAALKRGLKDRAPEVRVAAARGYAVMRDPGSTRDLKAFLREAFDGKQPREAGEAAIEAYAAIRDPGSHGDLVDLVAKPTDSAERRVLARAAVDALTSYRALPPRQRAAVVDDLVRAMEKLYVAAKKRLSEKTTEATYWLMIEPEMVRAFNALTGQNHSDSADCSEWWTANRRRFAESGS